MSEPIECEWCGVEMTPEELEYEYEGEHVCRECIRFDDVSEDNL